METETPEAPEIEELPEDDPDTEVPEPEELPDELPLEDPDDSRGEPETEEVQFSG